MTKVFLSHSSKDKTVVRSLAVDLRKHGIDVWLDEWEIGVGDSISQKIEQGIQGSDFIAIWLTESAITSGWVDREWRTKFEDEVSTNKTIILPLLADDIPLPPLLRDKRYADFRKEYMIGLSQLLSVPGLNFNATKDIVQESMDKNTYQGTVKKRNHRGLYSLPILDMLTNMMASMFLFLALIIASSMQEKGLISRLATEAFLKFTGYALVVLALASLIAIVIVAVKRHTRHDG